MLPSWMNQCFEWTIQWLYSLIHWLSINAVQIITTVCGLYGQYVIHLQQNKRKHNAFTSKIIFCFAKHGKNVQRRILLIHPIKCQQEGTQKQNERNKYLLKHKFRGVHGGEQSWNYSKQQERNKPPEVDSLESSPSRYQWKIICTRLGWQIAR